MSKPLSKPLKLRLAALLLGAAAVTTAYHHSTEQAMLDTATRFVKSLDAGQRSKAMLNFNSPGRENWHFVPDSSFTKTYGYGRRGVSYKTMTPEQRRLATALLSSGLSPSGFVKTMSIMSLEERLRVKEKDTAGRRDVEKYYMSVFGTPAAMGAWGWRVEGHHVSLHYTLKNGKLISASPTFFGANPHRIASGARALPKEEDLGRDLLRSLGAKQKKTAIVTGEAYPDVLTRADTRAKLEDQPKGLAASAMTAPQRETLMALIGEYVHNVPASIAAERMNAVKGTSNADLLFAWAGSGEPGEGHYYRVQAPSFLIEYDNTQGGANHSHTVWRDFAGDFGRDVLALHHQQNDHGLGTAVAAD